MAEKPKEEVSGPETENLPPISEDQWRSFPHIPTEAETPEKISLEEVVSLSNKQRDHIEAFEKGHRSIRRLETLLMEEIKDFVARNFYHLNLVESYGERWRENNPEGEQREALVRLAKSDAINGRWPL